MFAGLSLLFTFLSSQLTVVGERLFLKESNCEGTERRRKANTELVETEGQTGENVSEETAEI